MKVPARHLLAVLAGSAVLYLLVGYDVASDLAQYLIPVFRDSVPDFAPGDWFTHETTHFHLTFQAFLTAAARLGALDLGLYIWHGVTLVLLATALTLWLPDADRGRRVGLVVAAALLLALGQKSAWGGYNAIQAQVTPAHLSQPLMLLTLWGLYARRVVPTALALTATVYVHLGAGAMLMATMGLVALVPGVREGRFRVAAIAIVVALLAALPVLLSLPIAGSSDPEAYRIYFYGRSPHHFLVHEDSLYVQVKSLFILFVFGYMAWVHPDRDTGRFLAATGAAIVGLGIAGVLAISVFYFPAFAQLFPLRLLPVLIALVPIAIVQVLAADGVLPGRRLTAALLGLAWVVAGVSLKVALPIVPLAIAAHLLGDRVPYPVMARRAVYGMGALALVVAAAVTLSGTSWTDTVERYARQPVLTAIREHTPEGSLLLVSPEIHGVRIGTGRAIVVNLKAFPVFPEEMREWRRRMLDLTGLDALNPVGEVWRRYESAFRERPLDEIARTARAYDVDYLVLPDDGVAARELAGQGREPLWSGPRYVLYPAGALEGAAGAGPMSGSAPYIEVDGQRLNSFDKQPSRHGRDRLYAGQ